MAALTEDQRRWLERQAALAAAARRVWPDAAAPYAGTMRIRSGGRARDVLIGDGGHVGAVVRIDHASAPLAEVFYGCRPGDAYEVEAGARVLTGELVERARVRFAGGALVEVAGDGVRLRRVGDAWVAEPDPPLVTVSGPRRAGGLVGFAQLDAAQRAAVEAPGGAALILGEAGAGKTTVALHRLAWRRRALEAAGRRCRALVVVPNAALGRMVEGQLAALGLPEVPVVTFDDWAWRQAARAFVDWPRRRSGDATAATVALKRHPALLAEIEALARALPPAAEGRCGRRAQLIHLFGDRDRVARVAAAGLPAGAVAETLEHCHVQFSDPAEVEWSHVDAARLRTIDARLIDEGTPMADAGSADVEDAAVMFALDRALAAASGRAAARPRRYDVLVVDEAQALTAVELALLGRAVAAGGDLVVAGDAGQHFDEGVAFAGWPAALAALGAPGARVTRLRTSYRCPPALARWARRWVEPSAGSAAVGSAAVGAVASEASVPVASVPVASAPVASAPVASAPVTSAMASTGTASSMASTVVASPGEVPSPAGSPAAVTLHRAAHRCHLALAIIEALDALPAGHTAAVITRTPAGAAAWAALLGHGLAVRHAADGDLRPGAGVAVLPVAHARGLEFDVVVVPDAGPGWADTAADRRALYVAATRAAGRLVLATVGRWAPILRGSGVERDG